MEKFHAMFHGTDVYINGRYKYSSNEILTAYLNLDLDMKYLTDLHFYLRQSMKNLKLRTDYSDEERFVDYERNMIPSARKIPFGIFTTRRTRHTMPGLPRRK